MRASVEIAFSSSHSAKRVAGQVFPGSLSALTLLSRAVNVAANAANMSYLLEVQSLDQGEELILRIIDGIIDELVGEEN